MPRPRAFDEEQVLTAVMKAFWEKGYNATSAEDLVNASGLGRSSLYNAFSSKEVLFERSLDCYLSHTRQVVKSLLDNKQSPSTAIRVFLESALEAGASKPMGCLVTNTAIERGGNLGKILQRHFNLLREALTQTIKRGQSCDEFNPKLNPKISAELILTLLQGLRVQAKSTTSTPVLQQTIELCLKQLF